MQTQGRMEYVDACKGLGIILVIAGHTYYAPQIVYNIIYSFHMPLFFIIAGYTYNKEKYIKLGYLQFVKKKARELLYPYFAFGFLNLGIQIIWKALYLNETISNDYLGTNIKGIFLCYSNMLNMPNCSPIWFLMCLFWSMLLFYWVASLKDSYAFIVALACMGISWLFSKLPHDYTSYPFKFPVFFMATFLLYIGYIFRQITDRMVVDTVDKVKITKTIALLLLCCSLILEIVTGNAVGMNENDYGNILVYLVTAILIPGSMLMITKNSSKIPLFHSAVQGLIWLGKNTLIIVGFNYLCRDIAIELYYFLPIIKNYEITYFPIFILTLILCICIVWIENYVKNKIEHAMKSEFI